MIYDDLWWFMMIYGPFMESATETMFACHACRARHPCRHRSPNYWPHHYGKKWFGLIRKISVIIHELCQSVLWHWSSLVNCYSHIDPQDHPSTQDLKTRWAQVVALRQWWLMRSCCAQLVVFVVFFTMANRSSWTCHLFLWSFAQLLWSFLGFRAGLPEQSTSTWPLLAWMTRLGCCGNCGGDGFSQHDLGHDYVVPFCTQTRQWNITRKMGVLIWRSSVSMEYVPLPGLMTRGWLDPPQMASHWVWNVDDLIKGLLFLQTNKKHKITWLWCIYIYIHVYDCICIYIYILYIYIYYSELLQYII